jgi:DNA repair exonuclease SbcCD ATPase subunit
MSILWALTGSLDPRPFDDSKVSDVVNDLSKVARVSLKGSINAVDFTISRTKTAAKGSLTFVYDGEDVTSQSVKETQEIIQEKLGINPQVLARTMFHGQHSLDALLESTDSKLKDELSLIVPLTNWQQAVTITRKRAREANKLVSEFDGMLAVRSKDFENAKARLHEAEASLASQQTKFSKTQSSLQSEIDKLAAAVRDDPEQNRLSYLEDIMLQEAETISSLETKIESAMKARDVDLKAHEMQVEELMSTSSSAVEHVDVLDRQLNDFSLKLALARHRRTTLEELWNIDLSGGLLETFSPPVTCPVCRQSISRSDSDPTHRHITETVQREAFAAISRLNDAQSALDDARTTVEDAETSQMSVEMKVKRAKSALKDKTSYWSALILQLDHQLKQVRSAQQSAASEFAAAAKQLQQDSRIQSLNATINAEKEVLIQREVAAISARDEVERCSAQLEEIRKGKLEQTSMSKTMSELSDAFGQRGVQTFVLQNAVSALESAAQSYLNDLSEGTLRLQLSLDAGDRISRRAFVQGESGTFRERPMASLSGGQWRRCSLALNLGFHCLVSNRGNFRSSVCVMDEPLTHLDQSGRAAVGRVLRRMLRRTSEAEATNSLGFDVSTILIILQDLAAEELEESFDCIDEVVKCDGVSEVLVDEAKG